MTTKKINQDSKTATKPVECSIATKSFELIGTFTALVHPNIEHATIKRNSGINQSN